MEAYSFPVNFFATLIAWLTPIIFFPVLGRNDSFTCKVLFMGILSIIFFYLILDKKIPLERIGWKKKESLAIKFYTLFIVVSTIFALDPVMAFVGYTGRLDGLLTFFFYFAIFFMGHGCRNLKDSFFQGIALSSLIVASFTISEALGYRPYTNAVYREIRFLQPVSSMGNRNFLGTYLATTLPFHFYLAFERKKPFFYISFFTVAGALAIAQARGPWLGAAAGFLLYAILLIRSGRLKGKKLWIIPLLCLVLIFALILLHYFVDLPFITRFLSIFRDMKAFLIHGFDATKAGSHRVFVWKKALGIVKHYPIFGVGPENMQNAMENLFHDDVVRELGRYLNYDKAHNEYLNIAVSSGIPALLSYLLFVGLCLYRGLGKIHNPAYLVLFISLFIYLVQAFFNISVPNTAYLLWLFLGIFSGEKGLATENGYNQRKESPNLN